jgi:uncharacterized protein YeaO (DUF488 family)
LPFSRFVFGERLSRRWRALSPLPVSGLHRLPWPLASFVSVPLENGGVTLFAPPARAPHQQGRLTMPLRIVRLGSPRHAEEGLRIGTVRRPPRGVPKADLARRDWYDVWFPTLAPSAAALKLGQAAAANPADLAAWARFSRSYNAEMKEPQAQHALDLLAALSNRSDFSVGCYCAQESRCHRSLLRALLEGKAALIAKDGT